MKVVQVIPFFGMGGAEIMCESLVYELRKLGHEVVVVSLYNKKTPITTRIEKSCAEIRYLDKKAGLDFSMFGKLKKLFEKEKPDVIHSHLYVSKYVFPVAAKMKIRVVHTIHNVAEKENGRLERKLNNFFFKHCHLIPVAFSELIRDAVAEMRKIMEDWNGWLRRRIRMYIWKQWKKPKTRVTNLKRLGMPEWQAYRNGNTRKGYWRIAGSGILTHTITNERLARRGYYDISEAYKSMHSI